MEKNIEIKTDFKNSHTGLWLFVGLIGAGKTTFAQRLWSTAPKETIRSSLDEIIQMMSFYNYEPKMNGFYTGIERSAIIDGLINGYKVIVDRTNITKKIRSQFILIISKIKELSEEYLHLYETIKEDVFIKRCEKHLIENILIEESRRNISIYSSFLKLIRDWKMKRKEQGLFPEKSSLIREKLKNLMQTEIVCVYFDIPFEICIERRMNDPYNVVRDRVQKINWKAVIKRMKKKFEPPDKSEGFDRMYVVNQSGRITLET